MDTISNVNIVTTDGFVNGSQTYALVSTSDIAYGTDPDDVLTISSVASISESVIDAVGAIDGDVGDHDYFGAPTIGPNPAGVNWDTASQVSDGIDTDSGADWMTQDNFELDIEQGDMNELLSTSGTTNAPEPRDYLLLVLGLAFIAMKKRRGKLLEKQCFHLLCAIPSLRIRFRFVMDRKCGGLSEDELPASCGASLRIAN